MKKPKVSSVEAVKTSYPQLADETKQLNQLITDVGASVEDIVCSLRRIGLHVSAWHQIAGGEDEHNGYTWSRDIGYTRIGGLWHIAVREWSQGPGEPPEPTIYKFGDAPPWMCLEAAGKIPELIQELIERTRDMRAKISTKKSDLDEIAAALTDMAQEAASCG